MKLKYLRVKYTNILSLKLHYYFFFNHSKIIFTKTVLKPFNEHQKTEQNQIINFFSFVAV